ncbi:hypothetical protein [Altererythrobacter aquiaggeris]|uniref:hypothetical protein n=1 Tax=Aestuarierythrobacter aquiaggeris TaxID=1898396 RepID=UPI00301B5F2E
MRAFFLIVPCLWAAVGWRHVGFAQGLSIGLLSFIFASAAYLFAHRFALPAKQYIAAFSGFIGPLLFALVQSSVSKPDCEREECTTITVSVPPGAQ